MHAKCLGANGARTIVSSADLTDYALEANMEFADAKACIAAEQTECDVTMTSNHTRVRTNRVR